MLIRTCKIAPLVALFALLTGCANSPTIDIGGSFFPSWMICLTIGIALTVSAQMLFEKRGLSAGLGAPVIFFPSLALLLSCVFWLLLFS